MQETNRASMHLLSFDPESPSYFLKYALPFHEGIHRWMKGPLSPRGYHRSLPGASWNGTGRYWRIPFETTGLFFAQHRLQKTGIDILPPTVGYEMAVPDFVPANLGTLLPTARFERGLLLSEEVFDRLEDAWLPEELPALFIPSVARLQSTDSLASTRLREKRLEYPLLFAKVLPEDLLEPKRLWNLLDIIWPGRFGREYQYRSRYCGWRRVEIGREKREVATPRGIDPLYEEEYFFRLELLSFGLKFPERKPAEPERSLEEVFG